MDFCFHFPGSPDGVLHAPLLKGLVYARLGKGRVRRTGQAGAGGKPAITAEPAEDPACAIAGQRSGVLGRTRAAWGFTRTDKE